MMRIILSSLLLLSLAACGNEPAGKTTTKLDAVEVQPGTVSDSMIILDDKAGDGTAIDNSVPDDAAKKDVAKPDDEADSDSDDESSDSADAVAAPTAKKAVTPDDDAEGQ